MARPIPFLHRLLAGRRGAVTVLGAAALVSAVGVAASMALPARLDRRHPAKHAENTPA